MEKRKKQTPKDISTLPQTPSLKKAMAQARMLAALEASLGVVTIAAKQAGIDRTTHYEWYGKDMDYRTKVDSIADIALDFVENKLFKQIEEGEIASTIFYMKTKGKSRGYIEKTEIDHSIGVTTIKVIRGDK